MNSNLALSFAASRPVRMVSARKPVQARVRPAARPQSPAPSLGGRAETVLMAASFVALAGLALVMEAAGVAALVG